MLKLMSALFSVEKNTYRGEQPVLIHQFTEIKKNKNTEKRRSKRWNLVNSLRVFDQETQGFVGYLMDINRHGMMLASEDSFPAGTDFYFWIEVMSEKIPVTARTLWTKKDDEWGYCKNGFRFVNPTSKMTANITCLIEALKFQEHENL